MTQTNQLPSWFREYTEARFEKLYGPEKKDLLIERLAHQVIAFMDGSHPPRPQELWNEEDILLISYGDSVQQKGKIPLETLYEFLELYLKDAINSVHILPYFPYSSDDGFAVIDYNTVNPEIGTWKDISRIANSFSLMTDLVINHVSSQNQWFNEFREDRLPGKDYFITLPPDTDVSGVVRPRNTPLLVPVETTGGIKHVWATFSADQIDVNFANPDVLFEYIAIFLEYIRQGSRFIRLDAIAFLWKTLGTRCINLRETHEVVKLLRDIVELVAPHVVIITETNVPHGENLSYFGHSDETHMIYQFILPPLLLNTMYNSDARQLTHWSQDMPRAPQGCTYLNFIASHDGIGLRPVEGILPEAQVHQLVEAMKSYGGAVSMKANADGVDTPYEINISLIDAMKGTAKGDDTHQVARFICAHVIMMALQGIPAFYINSLLGTENDHEGVNKTGMRRAINRHKWDLDKLATLLSNPESLQSNVFPELKRIMSIRRQQAAFHPSAEQSTQDYGQRIFALWRHHRNRKQRILCVSNVTAEKVQFRLPEHPELEGSRLWRELIMGKALAVTEITLAPYQSVWLEALA